MDLETSERFMEMSRFWVQRVLVPILVIIGAGGNIVTVMVLTRRRMRCSTNIYLTALAVADLIYLLFVLILSFERYPNIHDIRYELYWRFYGINHWMCDAASSISIWLVVCFTIERYIAVCHPIRGKVLCTENRAKRVISAVCVLCVLATVSTSLEYQLTTSADCQQKVCIEPTLETLTDNFTSNDNNQTDNLASNDNNIVTDITNDSQDIVDLELNKTLSDCLNQSNEVCRNVSDVCELRNKELLTYCMNLSKLVEEAKTEDCCIRKNEIQTERTNLGKNETYMAIFYWFTSIIFTFLPLTLIATFNCFLVNAVRKSQKTRKEMTKSQENSTQAQENRMTLILICVVILFLICQTPSAFLLIYTSIYHDLDRPTDNLTRGLGNIFNLLVSINAACNFLLYCVLSDKYRRTFKALFCGRRAVGRHDTYASSHYQRSQRLDANPNTRRNRLNGMQNGFKHNISAYLPRNYETQSLNSIPRAKTVIVRPTAQATVGKLV